MMDSRERMKPARSGDELASGRKHREEERGLDDLFVCLFPECKIRDVNNEIEQ